MRQISTSLSRSAILRATSAGALLFVSLSAAAQPVVPAQPSAPPAGLKSGPQPALVPQAIQDANRMLRRGELDAALKTIDSYLEKEPKDVRARFVRALVLTDRKQVDDAISAFADIVQDHPELPEPYNNLAVLYAGRGQYDQARDALLAALRANPTDATAQENLGDVYLRLAARSYEQVLRQNAASRSARLKLARLRGLGSTKPEDDGAGSTPGAPTTERSSDQGDTK